MSVTINTNQSTAVKRALSDSLATSAISATKMATGEAILHAYEAPTALSIGLKMGSDINTLQTVLKGVQQSESMLYIAEAGIRSALDITNKMTEILAQAKLGYMTDELVQTTLSPTYMQLKAELLRIADSVNFNGQQLLNGQGGIQVAGVKSDVASIPTSYIAAANSVTKLAAYDASSEILTGLSASTVTGGTAGAVTFSTNVDAVAPTVTGGIISTDPDGCVILSGATLIFNSIVVTDSADKKGVGNLTITDVDLKFNLNEFAYANGQITIDEANAPQILSQRGDITTMGQIDPSNISFSNISGDIIEVSGFSDAEQDTIPSLADITAGTDSFITNLKARYALSGGIASGSTFSFVTGNNLNSDVVMLQMPNLRLTTGENKVLGVLDTLNINDNLSQSKPTDLTNLSTVADADTDIPLIQGVQDFFLSSMNQCGAFEIRLGTIVEQLQNNVEALQNAKGEFMNADLADQTEIFTRSSVQSNIAVSAIRQMNDSLQTMQGLVS